MYDLDSDSSNFITVTNVYVTILKEKVIPCSYIQLIGLINDCEIASYHHVTIIRLSQPQAQAVNTVNRQQEAEAQTL